MPGSRGVLVLAAALALSGCVVSTDVERPPQSIVVHAVLDMAAPDQLLLLERSRAGVKIPDYSSDFNDPALPILGARVTITGPNGVTMVAREDRLTDSTRVKGVYRLKLAEYGATLEPGGQYVLRVHTDLGDASGTTTIPRASAAASSAPELFFRVSDTLRLSWPKVDGAHTYEVRLQETYLVGSQVYYGNTYVVFSDTALKIPGVARNFDDNTIFRQGSVSQVVVSAVDANYYDYFRQTSDIFLGGAPSRLTGAIGVFGSMVPVMVRQLQVR